MGGVTHSPATPRAWRRAAIGGIVALSALSPLSCGRSDRAGELTRGTLTGPDPIVVRVARKGGKARAYRYPALDTAIWTSTQNVPAVGGLLAFDHENGVVAYADTTGTAGWIDLRMGAVRSATKKRFSSIATADGWSIFGVSDKNEIVRFTPTGEWTLPLKDRKISRLLPQKDGTLLILIEGADGKSLVTRFRPPDSRLLDSLELERPQFVARTDVGDRVYFALEGRLVAISTAGLQETANVRVAGEILALAPTPSGDRLYIVTRNDAVDVFDRYSGEIVAHVPLPGLVTDLRMDVLGRYVLARSALGDTTWVISTASNKYLGAVESQWREDLPAVMLDGKIATVRGADVMFVDPVSREEGGRVTGGAADHWFFMLWNGFRPRAQGIDQPVQFSWRGQDSVMARALGDTATVAFVGRDVDTTSRTGTVPPPIESLRPPIPQVRTSWTVSFAVVLSEERARALASEISVEGERAHVVAGRSGDTPVFRVVLGPYPTRGDAERVGRASGRQFWVYDGVP